MGFWGGRHLGEGKEIHKWQYIVCIYSRSSVDEHKLTVNRILPISELPPVRPFSPTYGYGVLLSRVSPFTALTPSPLSISSHSTSGQAIFNQ
jgi:hypothetical protein